VELFKFGGYQLDNKY
jgi:magnesium-transporting ATPase (P-type)